MEIMLEQRFIQQKLRNGSTDNVENVARLSEERTFRVKRLIFGQDSASTGQVFPVNSWTIRPGHPELHSSNHIRQLYTMSHVLK